MKRLILISLLALAGCGGGDDDSAPAETQTQGPSLVAELVTCIITILAAENTCGSPTNSAPPGDPPSGDLPPDDSDASPPPDDDGGNPLGASSPWVWIMASDVEPNNGISTASPAIIPTGITPEQSVGFAVNGAINNLMDGVDTYAFAAARTREFRFEICEPLPGFICRPDRRLDVEIAYLSVLDQFGNVLLSSQGDDVIGNLQQMHIDAGVIYYVMVLAEDTMDADQEYRLEVFESLN